MPGLGFRPATGLRLRERTVVSEDDRAIAVTELVSTSRGTELAFEIRDPHRETDCLAGRFDHRSLDALTVTVRDERGAAYPRSATILGSLGIGQHDFGFFRRSLGFAPLDPAVRLVTVEVAGALGEWRVPVAVAPLEETAVLTKDVLDASTSFEGLTVRLLGIARGGSETILELEAVTDAPGVTVRGIGALMQRTGEDRLVLVDGAGQRFEEEPARETIVRPGDREGRTVARFPPLPAAARELTLVLPAVVVEEEAAPLEVALPVTEPREVQLGRYRLEIAWAGAAELLSPPGEAPGKGLRIALGSRDRTARRRILRPAALAVDGVERRWGWGEGWHPEPGFINMTLDADPPPRTVTLLRPLVRVSGPWEIAFSLRAA